MELLIRYLHFTKTFPLELGGGIKWVREYVRNGGSNFGHFDACALIE